MKFTCDKTILYKAISKVQRASDNRSSLHSLQGILIESNGKSLKLTATDLSLAIQCIVEDVSVDESGSVLITAKFFSDLIRKLSGPITIETFGNKLKLDCGDLTATINAMDAEEFPSLPVISDAKELTIPSKILKAALTKTQFVVSTDDRRPVFTGVLFKASQGNVDFVATDTHRLAKFSHWIEGLIEIHAIVPSKATKELVRWIDGEVVKMSLTDSYAVFECENMKLMTKLIEGEFPNYEAIMPKGPEATISVSKALLKMAVERADVFSDQYHRIVQMKGKDSLSISGSSSLFGDIKQTIKVEHNGEDVKIAFNCEFLLQAINAMTEETISLSYFGTHAPMTFCEEEYLQLILPVRMES